MSYQSVKACDGTILQTFEKMTDGALETAIATTATCFEAWKTRSYADRAVVVANVNAASLPRALVDRYARAVALTGSVAAGRAVAAPAGRNLKKSTVRGAK